MTPPEVRAALVEHVAREMADNELWPGAFDGMDWRMPQAEQNVWRHRADAALTAISAMLAAAPGVGEDGNG